MLRFATSPTSDMHIGDLRVALINYIVAQQKKEDLIIRIEDINKENNIECRDHEILDILNLFGITYSQVIYQSQSIRFHSAMALQLMHEKKAFSCFCSSLWLEKKQKESKLASRGYVYDDACRNLPAELVIDNTSPFTIRIAKPDNNAVDSFIIMSHDKVPTSDFSSAVDDMLNDISVVIHSVDHKADTQKQKHIRESLDYDKKVKYVYLANIDNAPSVKYLLEEGFLPEAISNYLISIENNPFKGIFTVEKASEWFTLDTLSKSSIEYDITTLRHINKEHLKSLDAKELSRYVGFADTEIGELARIYLDEVSTTKELKAKIAPIFSQRIIPEVFNDQTTVIKNIIKGAPYFEEYEEFKKYIMKESKLEGEDFFMSLRILLTNAQNGPDLAMIYKYLKNYIGEIIK